MADETAIDRGPPRHRVESFPGQSVLDGARTPAGVSPAQLQDAGLHHRAHLMGTAGRARAVVGQACQSRAGIAAEPVVHGLAGHPIAAGHLGDAGPVGEHLRHRLVALLHQPQLHEHEMALLRLLSLDSTQRRRGGAGSGGPSSVRQVPEPVSPRYRNRVPEVSGSYRATVSSMNRSRTAPLASRCGLCVDSLRWRSDRPLAEIAPEEPVA